jgi:UDP-hydrolysing UDP-N-acetyl-D-glucosamine 2-epimerase
MKRTICAVITARASYARIKTALAAIRDHPDLTLRIVVAGSAVLERYGDIRGQMQADGFEIAAWTNFIVEGENLVASVKSTGLGLIEMGTLLDRMAPDAVISVADRYETLATAVSAAYMNIPLIHVQGGEVTGSIDEKVRHAVTKLADLHFTATARAAERVVRMGENPARVHVTGCPSIDLAARVARTPALDFDPMAKYGGVGAPLDLAQGYAVVLQHPVTTEYDICRRNVTETLHAVAGLDMPTLWFWPNVDAGSDGTSKGIRAFRELHRPENIRFFKNMAPEDFLRLLCNCRMLVGNSSVGIRECSFLGVPVVNVGSRQAGRERGGNVLDTDYTREGIASAMRRILDSPRPAPSTLYGDGTAGVRMADLLASQPLVIEKKLPY